MDWSQNGATDQMKGLDWSEHNIFEATKMSQDNVENWIKGDNSIMKASAMIVNHKKRKLAHTEII